MRRYFMILILCLFLCGCDNQISLEDDNRILELSMDAKSGHDSFLYQMISLYPHPGTFDDSLSIQSVPDASEILSAFSVWSAGRDLTASLIDDNHYTKHSIHSNDTLVISSDVPFGGLYFEWDCLPGTFEVSWDSGSMLGGTQGFLHEYLSLPEAVQDVSITFIDDASVVISGFRLFAYGSPPSYIQVWEPADEYADILVFPTHSDDESLFFGALIAYYAIERELTVQTAFMVNHLGYPERSHERLDALWELGVRNYPVLGNAPDTASHSFSECINYYWNSGILDWQVELIRRFRPLVVVGHDLNGEYGNGGHKVNSYYLTKAVDLASDVEYHAESASIYGIWDSPKLYLHLYENNELLLDVNTSMANDISGRTPFEVAQDAYQHHHSQHKWSFRVSQDDDLRMYDCRPFGLYRTLVGDDSCADFMDHIVRDDWR